MEHVTPEYSDSDSDDSEYDRLMKLDNMSMAGRTNSKLKTKQISGLKLGDHNNVKNNKWYDKVIRAIRAVITFLQQNFIFPLQPAPISFYQSSDFNEEGDWNMKSIEELQHEKDLEDNIEVICNYDVATKELFENILKDRKETKQARHNYRAMKIDLSRFPKWDRATIKRFQYIFRFFDLSGDGWVDFEEMNSVLLDFGDRTPMEVKRKHFQRADKNNLGALDFIEFLTMVYDLLEARTTANDHPLVETFRIIDRNSSKIRSLDIIQQLQVGLF